MAYRLSICIPTCNRDVYLESSLRRLFDQIGSRDGEIEVLVSDNASDDRTETIVKQYSLRPSFRYMRRKENGGAERNFLDVIAAATGEYCWLLGDDDVLLPGAVDHILQVLEDDPADLHVFSTPESRWVHERTEFPNFSAYVEHFASSRVETLREATLISLSIFRRFVWEAVSHKERYIPTRYVHGLVLAEALRDSGCIVVHPDALISVPRHRATVHDPNLALEIEFCQFQYLMLLAQLTRSPTLSRICVRERFHVVNHSARKVVRLTRRYLQNCGFVFYTLLRSMALRPKTAARMDGGDLSR